MMIRLKRVYDPVEPSDGRRFLVERLWPRGIRKEALHLEGWLKEVAPTGVPMRSIDRMGCPSDALRRWFAHDPAKWPEFRRRYFAELDHRPDT
ncbi:hypothetical protein HRbin08_00049 [bacterium HR08]|nr:hypothetical protein HRbin08_00049 [bacterium HR08]